MTIQQNPQPIRSIQRATPLAKVAAPVVASQGQTVAGPSAKAGGSKVKDPALKNPKAYVPAVEAAEAAVKAGRKKLSTAESGKANIDANTKAAIAKASNARDTQQAEVIKPLQQADLALAKTRASLQAPIDQTSGQVDSATAALERATFPDKIELDRARADARAAVSRRESALSDAESTLDAILRGLPEARTDLRNNQDGAEQSRNSLANADARLRDAVSSLQRASYGAPSSYEIDQLGREVSDAERDNDKAAGAVEHCKNQVNARQRELDNLLNNDRPTPPSASDRPTPPSAGGRPTPPGVSDRPKPPSASGGSSEIQAARQALSQAESELKAANKHAGETGNALGHARKLLREKSDVYNVVVSWQNSVNDLTGERNGIQGTLDQHVRGIDSANSRIDDLERRQPGAERQQALASEDLGSARQQLGALNAQEYAAGDPGQIKAAKAVLDPLTRQLASLNAAYTAGVKAPAEKAAQARATFEAAMAPFHEAVQRAEAQRATALQAAEPSLSGAQGELRAAESTLANLKAQGLKKWWGWPKWLGGHGFSVKKFWKARPAV